jgi:hypothetical protein
MDDVSLLFQDIVIPIAPSILYERQGVIASTPPASNSMRKKSKATMRAELFLNLATFIERGANTSNSRRTPTATLSKNITLSSSTTTILRNHK